MNSEFLNGLITLLFVIPGTLILSLTIGWLLNRPGGHHRNGPETDGSAGPNPRPANGPQPGGDA